MTFTTLTFVLFLGVVFGIYWVVRGKGQQNVVLLVASYVFYGWWDVRFCALIAASSVIDYAIGRAIGAAAGQGARRALLSVSVAANIGLLGVFKYFNFFTDNLGLTDIELRLVLPVGISFYTFQTLGYTIDVYRKTLPPTRNFIDYMAYVSFFPQLVAGPIERGARLLPQLTVARRFDPVAARDGCRQILWGFFKKMALADNVAQIANVCYGTGAQGCTGPQVALSTVCFAFQIYWDFSAYSDIAIGTGRLFGVSLRRNFATPYFSQTLGEFWRRWHISLSTWFRDYVYIPLGGSRRGPLRTALNLMVTFLVSGLWHGAAWHFVAWGGLHGAAYAPSLLRQVPKQRTEDTPGGEAILPSPRVLFRMLRTFALVCVFWVFFRAATFAEAIGMLGTVVSDLFRPATLSTIQGDAHWLAMIGLIVMVEWLTRRHPHPMVLDRWPRIARWSLYTLLIWLTLGFAPFNASEFIYFQF